MEKTKFLTGCSSSILSWCQIFIPEIYYKKGFPYNLTRQLAERKYYNPDYVVSSWNHSATFWYSSVVACPIFKSKINISVLSCCSFRLCGSFIFDEHLRHQCCAISVCLQTCIEQYHYYFILAVAMHNWDICICCPSIISCFILWSFNSTYFGLPLYDLYICFYMCSL